MNKKFKLIAAVGAAVLSCAAVHAAPAKTLVFCSEGSPEGFNPQLFTTGTTFDASSVPIYNRLVAFELGSTRIVPALAESWTVSDDGLTYTFKLRNSTATPGSSRAAILMPTTCCFPSIACWTRIIRSISFRPDRASVFSSTWAWKKSSPR